MTAPLIAIIDDDISNSWALSLVLEDWGYRTVRGTDAVSVLDDLARLGDAPDMVITDYHLTSSTGVEVTNVFRRQFGETVKAVIITGTGRVDAISAQLPDDVPVLTKPVDPDALKVHIDLNTNS